MDRKQIVNLMKDHGYKFKREGGNHEVWESPSGHILAIPRGEIEWRLSRKIRLDIERGESRRYNTIVQEKPKTGMAVAFQKAEIITATQIQEKFKEQYSSHDPYSENLIKPVIEAVEELIASNKEKNVDQKKVGPETRAMIAARRATGDTLEKIAADMRAQGYIGPHGGQINLSFISKFMAHKAKTRPAKVDSVKRKTTQSSMVHDLTEILSSNLSEELKQKFVLGYVKDIK